MILVWIGSWYFLFSSWPSVGSCEESLTGFPTGLKFTSVLLLLLLSCLCVLEMHYIYSTLATQEKCLATVCQSIAQAARNLRHVLNLSLTKIKSSCSTHITFLQRIHRLNWTWYIYIFVQSQLFKKQIAKYYFFLQIELYTGLELGW